MLKTARTADRDQDLDPDPSPDLALVLGRVAPVGEGVALRVRVGPDPDPDLGPVVDRPLGKLTDARAAVAALLGAPIANGGHHIGAKVAARAEAVAEVEAKADLRNPFYLAKKNIFTHQCNHGAFFYSPQRP